MKLELEVGTQIYRINGGHIQQLITIDRVTKTQSISKGGTYRFKRFQTNKDWLNCIGNRGFSTVTYVLRHKELDIEFNNQINLNKIKRVKWDLVSSDSIRKILKMVNAEKQQD